MKMCVDDFGKDGDDDDDDVGADNISKLPCAIGMEG